MAKNGFHDHPGWRWCTAQGARALVLLLGLQTTFREKLEWLEEAETLALRLRKNRESAKMRSASRKLISLISWCYHP